MKKLLAIVLALTLVLSMSATAYAKVVSPTKTTTTDDLPATTNAAVAAPAAAPAAAAPAAAEAAVIANGEMSEDQQKAANEAIDSIVKDGYLPVETFAVKADAAATVVIEAEDGAVVFVVDPDGNVKKFPVEELTKVSDGHFELKVDGDCIVIIATKD